MTTDTIYRAVLFDLDGTLLNTLEDIANSANRVLERLGFPQHSLEAYKYFVGDGREALASRIVPSSHRDANTIARVVDWIDGEYNQHWADMTRPYEGVPELLQALTARGTKMAVLSNKPDDLTKLMVSTILSHWQFELVIGVRPSVPRKPDPAAALDIAECLKIVPREFLYLGDTDTDMKTADASGMYPIGASWGFRTADELLANGAKALISKPMELLKFL
ncbi:HAD family hydrolase [Chloroflexota bacterium]